MIHGAQRFAIPDRGHRDAEQRRQIHDLLDGVCGEPVGGARADQVALLPAPDLEAEFGNVGQIRALDHGAEVLPLLAGRHRDADVAVLGALDRRHLGGPTDDLEQHQFPTQPGEHLHRSGHGLQHRQIGPATTTVMGGQPDRGRVTARHELAQVTTHRDGGRSGSPRDAVDPHQACSVNSVAGRSVHGPAQPKSDSVTTVRSASTSTPSSSAPSGVAPTITMSAAASNPARHRRGGDTALAAGQEREERAFGLSRRDTGGSVVAQPVAVRRLDHHHVGAGVAQQLAGVGGGQPVADLRPRADRTAEWACRSADSKSITPRISSPESRSANPALMSSRR